jgi:hypothetical protein
MKIRLDLLDAFEVEILFYIMAKYKYSCLVIYLGTDFRLEPWTYVLTIVLLIVLLLISFAFVPLLQL